jgi:hypothetical protein
MQVPFCHHVAGIGARQPAGTGASRARQQANTRSKETRMGITVLTATAALTLSALTSAGADAPSGAILAQAMPTVPAQATSMTPNGNYMTLANGCTYRRTQAPGHPPRWILVLNPHHLGLAVSRARCSGMM